MKNPNRLFDTSCQECWYLLASAKSFVQMKVNTLDIFFQVVVHLKGKEKNLQETNVFPAVIMSNVDLKAANVGVFAFLICIFLVHLKGEVMKTLS